MTGPPKPARRWDAAVARHRADQRDQILAAALGLLRQRGIAGLTMASIAEEAGISRPALYHYFADIDSVLAAWVGREVERSVTELVGRAAGVADPAERLEHLVRSQCAAFASQEHRLGAEHFESETVAPAVRAEVSAKMAPLRDLLAHTIAELGSGVDPALGADILLGALGALRRRLITGEVGAAQAADAVLGLLRNGWLPGADRGAGSGQPRRPSRRGEGRSPGAPG